MAAPHCTTDDRPNVDGPRNACIPNGFHQDFQAQHSFWSRTLTGAPPMLDLPTDQPRASLRSTQKSKLSLRIDPSLTLSLRTLAAQYDMDLSMVVMASWGAVLSRLTSQHDIIIGFQQSGSSRLGSSKQADHTHILPLRMDLSGEPSISQLLGRVREIASSSVDHQDFPSISISEITNTPPFHVALLWNNQVPLHSSSIPINVDLELQLQEQSSEVVGNMVFLSDLFSLDTIKRHVGYLLTTLEIMAKDPTQPVETIDILSPEERRLILETWNETSKVYPDHLCLHQLFERQVDKTLDATAIVYEDQSLTYRELNARANRLAHHLIGLGVQPDTRVAICVERSPGMIIGILAIMKAGGAYVPLDPSHASGRLNDILQDASPTIAVADQIGQAVLEDSALTLVDPNTLLDQPISNPCLPELTPRHLAYIMYTSGSTGKPKGVMIEHRGTVNLVQTHTEFYGFHQDSRVLQFASMCFDASVWEITVTLSCGASLYLPPDSIRQDRDELWKYMAKHSITIASFTPSFLQEGKHFPIRIPSLMVSFGGESMSPVLLKNLLAEGYHVTNDFGPTEVTVSATSWRCPPDFKGDVVPIGRPAIHSRIYLLDKHGQPVPLGAIGEIYVGGIGVARGYLNRPELTAERFLPDPFADGADARMYRTGDLGRYLPDGNIVFLSRNDDQVKIRGFRIELGEIETRLLEYPIVEEAVVLAMGEGAAKRLVAYVVAKPDDQLVHTLRAYLVSRLPDYMIPAAIVRLDKLPLTSNDKIDRKALPEPDGSAFARQAYEEPRGRIEVCLAQLWTELLSIDRVSRNDDFFALGGHSLLAIRMLNRLRLLGLTAPVTTVYQSSVLSVLAQALEKYQSSVIPPNLITPQTTKLTPDMLPLVSLSQTEIDYIVKQTPGGIANIQDIYSLSAFQDGLLFHYLLAKESDPYLLSAQMAFETRDLLNRYLQAFQEVVNRHDILRTAFIWKNTSTPVQVVWRQASLPVQELKLNPTDGPITKQLNERFHPNHFRINLTQAPLLRLMIAQDTDGRWILSQLMHHIIGDHTAAEIMNHEIEEILHGRGNTLSTPHPFRNAIAQARSESECDIHTYFFKDMLGDVDEPTFPYGMAEAQNNGSRVAESHSILPQELNNRLRRQAKEMGVSLASLCHVAWSLILANTTGQERIVFGTVLFGGTQIDQETGPTMGIFINTLPFRCDINSQRVEECVRQAHTRLAALLEHEHASLALAQRCSGVPAGMPLFSALLNYLRTSLPPESSEKRDMEFISQEEQVHFPGIEVLGGWERTNYPFTISVLDSDTALGLTVQTQQPVDPSRVASYMKRALESLVDSLESEPNATVADLEVLPHDERELLLVGLNSVTIDFSQDQTLHHLFEQQVECTPQATAVVSKGQSLTYAELNERANILAHHLVGLGVKPDNLVAICVERSFAMIIGVLAILKAGGAYVPLDPAYASSRLQDILAEASPSIVVADKQGEQALGVSVLAPLTVVDPGIVLSADLKLKRPSGHIPQTDRLTSNPQIAGLTSNHLAYVIFTSGSTGRLKGVMVEHYGVVHLVMSRPEAYGATPTGNVALFPSFGFDSSVVDIFSTLSFGGCMHVLPDDIRMDRFKLWEYLEHHSITQTLLPPAILQECEGLPPLKVPLVLVIAGEALPAALVRALQEQIPNGRIVNDYGPTETTVSATTWKCPPEFDGELVPIGRPVANKKIYILNKDRQPVPLGAVGELYIGGVGVTRGYLNQPELTAKVFLPDPFAGDHDARMHKTGDMGRYLPDGTIVYLGRNDQQVKIRGFRIELGEIEARLVEHPLVQSAVVVTTGDGNSRRLVAYIVAKHDDQLVHTLQSHLTSCLPDYMVPAVFVRLDDLPLTTNGKVDRPRLPPPDGGAMAHQYYEAPQGDTETMLMTIWTKLLNIDKIGRHDNFFMLGGHSLLAVRMLHQIQSLMGFKIALGTLFIAPTIAELAPHLLTTTDNNIQENAFNVLLPIRPRGSRLPLFCIHPGIGLSWNYVGLSKYLHPDQPIYGLQARGFVEGEQSATSIEEMALDYISEIKRIQPHGPYYLLGYSFGGKVVHTMTAHLERQGERVALLAVMDTTPTDPLAEIPLTMEELDDDTRWFLNRVGDSFPDSATPYIERFRQVRWQISLLYRNHTYLRCSQSGMVLFRAMVQTDPLDILLSSDAWKPYIMGEIEVFDIDCVHNDMDRPAALAEIGSVLAQKLNEIHTKEAKGL